MCVPVAEILLLQTRAKVIDIINLRHLVLSHFEQGMDTKINRRGKVDFQTKEMLRVDFQTGVLKVQVVFLQVIFVPLWI